MKTPMRLGAMLLLLTLAGGCETYKVVDETVAGFVAGEDYAPADDIAKQLEEAQKLAEDAAKQAEEMAKLAEEAKAAAEAAKLAEEAAKEEIAAMEMAEMKAEVDAALDALKAEKAKQDDIEAMIAALDAREEEIVADYEAKEAAVVADYEAKEAEIVAKYEEEAQQPTRVNVKVYAEADANRNADGEASPVSVRVLALTSEHQLMGTDYFALQDDLPGALGATFVGELSAVSAEPGQFVSTGELEVPRTTQKIGVIASFADVDRAIWRDHLAVPDRGEDLALLVALDDSAVRIMREGEGPRMVVPVPAAFSVTDPVGDDGIVPDIGPFEADIFDDADPAIEDEAPAAGVPPVPDGDGAPVPDPAPVPEIFYDADAGSMVFLDGTTRMDSTAMLDPVDGPGGANAVLLMRDPAAMAGFDVRTLVPFMPADDFWDTAEPLFAAAPR